MSYGNKEKLSLDLPVVIDRQFAKRRSEMTAGERRLMYVAMSKIHPDHTDFRTVVFQKDEYYRLLKDAGINFKHGTFEDEIKESCDLLLSRVIHIDDGKSWLGFPLMHDARFDYETETVTLRFHEHMKPFLLTMPGRKGYAKFLLRYGMPLTSSYASSLYELFRSYVNEFHTICKYKMTLDEIRDFFELGKKYARYPDLKRKVIEQARKEINNKTDLIVTYTENKRRGQGRAVESITFTVTMKPANMPPDIESYLCWSADDLIDRIKEHIHVYKDVEIVLNERMLPVSEFSQEALARLTFELDQGQHNLSLIEYPQRWVESKMWEYSHELFRRQLSFDEIAKKDSTPKIEG